MNCYRHVVVSQRDLEEWITELSREEREMFGDGSSLELYCNWAATLGWRVVGIAHTRGPQLGLPMWHLMLFGESSQEPFPNASFRGQFWTPPSAI